MATTPPPGGAPAAPKKKPVAWIVATAVLAVAVIGLAVWGFSTKSDLDSANTKLANQEAAIAAAGKVEQTQAKIERQQVLAYSRIRRKLKGAKRTARQQRADIATQKSQVVTAQQQLDSAKSRDARLAAQANLAKQQLDVAQACMSGTISAIDSVFAAPNAKAGVNRLNHDLAALSADCKESVG